MWGEINPKTGSSQLLIAVQKEKGQTSDEATKQSGNGGGVRGEKKPYERENRTEEKDPISFDETVFGFSKHRMKTTRKSNF